MSNAKKVLFVCINNSCRSQMAEAFAHIYGKNIIEPYSAGSHPSGSIDAKAIEAMQEMSYDLSTHRSKSLAQLPNVEYEYAITMGCGDECPFVIAKHREDWNIPDPKHLPMTEFREVRNLIAEKVKALRDKLAHS